MWSPGPSTAAVPALVLLCFAAVFPVPGVCQAIPAPYTIPTTVQVIPTPLPPSNGRLQLLIITGRNSYEHDWRGTTNALRRMLEDTGRFEVHVTEEFRGATVATLKPYDAVLLNYTGRWFYSDPVEQRWGEPAESALFDYVRNGGGIVVYHATFTMGAPSWPEFERLAGGTLRSSPSQSRRSPVDGFRIHVVDRDDPITHGMREYMWTLDDDMYTNLRWDPATRVHVLVTGHDDPSAYSYKYAGPKYPPADFTPQKLRAMPGMDQDNALVWTSQYGKGRVYCFTLGHGPDTLQYDAVTSLLVRGAEWAASGRVTIPLKDKARNFEGAP